MPEISITKEFALEDALRGFKFEHRANIQEAQLARAMVEENLIIISHFMSNGLLTQKQFDRVTADDKLQAKYALMAEALDRANYKSFDVLNEDIKDRPDTLCGWLDYYNRHLENTLRLNLV